MLLLLCCAIPGIAQEPDAVSKKPAADTAQENFVTRVRRLAHEEALRSIDKFEEDRIAARQEELISGIIKTTQAARDFIKTGLDTIGLNTELTTIEKWHASVGDGIFTNKGTAQTYRNLETSGIILRELLDRILTRKSALDTYAKTLAGYKYKIDSLNSDSILYMFPVDSVELMHFLQKLVVVMKGVQPADSALKKALINVEALQTHVNIIVNSINTDIEQIAVFRKDISDNTFDREFANLGNAVGFARPIGEIINLSETKGSLALYFYVRNNIGRIILIFILIIAASFFYNNLKKQLALHGLLKDDYAGQLVLRYPYLSAIMIVLNIFQFIFPNPPFIFNALFWMISSVCLTFIFRKFITAYWMKVWLTMFILFILACLDNLVLQASRPERWFMMGISSLGIISGISVLVKGHRQELKEKWILYFIAFVVLLEIASLITNIFGRYNTSKTLLTSGYFNVIIGILFLWTVRLINEVLSLAAKVYRKPDKKLFYINFEKIGEKVPPLFYFFLFIGWLILFGRSFYSFRLVSEPVRNFLFAERTIGEYSFSLESMLVFILIIGMAAITSRIVSFFASEKHDTRSQGSSASNAGVGSWLLLIRIAIISTGLFLAFAAAGIPMDRIAIIVGALGVGVGFGLQTIVNNLVSGLIIAFEKPVNVGDFVEIAGHTGTMKSIGFRSSVLSRAEGADVVIPNGDILNAHLINWSLSSTKKRMDIVVGVAFSTDLTKAVQLLTEVLSGDERILKYPKPEVLKKDFNSSAIDLQLWFWVRHLSEALAVKSDVIAAIDLAFKRNDIVIPFPQQDIHVHSKNVFPAEDKERKDQDHSSPQ